jgi:hypothetical protein
MATEKTYRLQFPKGQVEQAFDTKGEAAARKVAEQLEVPKHKMERWVREWGPSTASKKPSAKPAKPSKGKAKKLTKEPAKDAAAPAEA